MYIERKLKEQSAIIKSLQDQLEESNVENKELRDLLEIPAESESRPITTTVSVISCKSLC
jgi:cell shape-determining protein MreC